MARDIGYQFVDFKHCHGYLLHELLGARSRPGKYGGSLENRTRFMRNVIDGIRAEAPGLEIAVRLSVFDMVPYRKGAGGRGEPEVGLDGIPARLRCARTTATHRRGARREPPGARACCASAVFD